MKKLLLFILPFMLAACDFFSGPDGAWKLGEGDKAVYVKLQDNDNENDRIYTGVIYSAKDESVIYKGDFDYSLHHKLDVTNTALFSHWDGERLYLIDNSFLKKVKK